jgi:hypothetical protein
VCESFADAYFGENIKATPVTGRRGPPGCETSRLSHFLNNRIIDGGEVVSLTALYSFLFQPESTPGPQCGWKNYVNPMT